MAFDGRVPWALCVWGHVDDSAARRGAGERADAEGPEKQHKEHEGHKGRKGEKIYRRGAEREARAQSN
jgi:hypothetical protein